MNGNLNASRQALIPITVRNPFSAIRYAASALIDTDFKGELVLPPQSIATLGLPSFGDSSVVLADGSHVELPRYTCLLEWLGELRQVDAFMGRHAHALIGTDLLADFRLVIDYPASTFALDPPSASGPGTATP